MSLILSGENKLVLTSFWRSWQLPRFSSPHCAVSVNSSQIRSNGKKIDVIETQWERATYVYGITWWARNLRITPIEEQNQNFGTLEIDSQWEYNGSKCFRGKEDCLIIAKTLDYLQFFAIFTVFLLRCLKRKPIYEFWNHVHDRKVVE